LLRKLSIDLHFSAGFLGGFKSNYGNFGGERVSGGAAFDRPLILSEACIAQCLSTKPQQHLPLTLE
jgi:hypothetical protein